MMMAFSRRPGADVAERPVVVHRRGVVVDHRLDRSLGVLGRSSRRSPCATACPPGRTTAGSSSAALSWPTIALPSPTSATSVGTLCADRLGRDVELDDAHVLGEARRQAEVHDPVEAGAQQEDDVGFLQRVAARGADRQRVVVGQHALAHGRGQERQLGALDEGAHLVLGARPGHALADDDERLLAPTAGRRGPARRPRGIACVRGGSGHFGGTRELRPRRPRP